MILVREEEPLKTNDEETYDNRQQGDYDCQCTEDDKINRVAQLQVNLVTIHDTAHEKVKKTSNHETQRDLPSIHPC